MHLSISKTTLPLVAVVVVLLAAIFAAGSASAQGDENLITPTGVAGVEVGTTIEELTESLDGYDVSDDVRLTVDLRGYTVSRDGRVVFRAAQVVPDSPQIELFIVSGDMYRTAEGIGPGSSIADAVQEYGEATFMLDRNNGGREFVVFANQPDGPIAFRTYGIAGAYVGGYVGDATMTMNYQSNAAIASVWIGCTSVKACIRSGSSVVTDSDSESDSDSRADAAEAEELAAIEAAEAAAEAAAAERAEAEAAAEAAAAEQAEAEAEAEAGADPADSSATQSQEAETLPKTGLAQTRQIAVVSILVLSGASLLLLERRFGLGPEWLR